VRFLQPSQYRSLGIELKGDGCSHGVFII